MIGVAIVIIYYVKFNSSACRRLPASACLAFISSRSAANRSTLAAFGRYLAYMLSAPPLRLGFMWVGWDEEKKGFHDMICGTRVIYGKL